MQKRKYTNKDGLTLLISLLLSSVVLAIGMSLLNITLKQFQLSGIANASEEAFHAARAGIECASYHDMADRFPFSATFATSSGLTSRNALSLSNTSVNTLNCMDDSDADTPSGALGELQEFEFEWTTSEGSLCAIIEVYKFADLEPMSIASVARDCHSDLGCTAIKSKGYNNVCGASDKSTVERELIITY